jgi:putative ABC transport system permease protein
LRRAAPTRLLASPGWLALVVASIALLVASLAAPALFARAASQAAFDVGLDAIADDAFTSTTANVRATWDGVLPEDATEEITRQLARLPAYGPPRVFGVGTSDNGSAHAVVEANGVVAPSTLYFREGALRRLGGDDAPGGVWLAEEIAEQLGLKVGDPMQVGIDRPASPQNKARARTTLAGTYRRLPGSALPERLAGDRAIARRDLPWDPDRPSEGYPIALASRLTFERLSRAIDDTPLWTADLTLTPGTSPAEAAHASTQIRRLATRAFDESTPLAGALRAAKPAPTRLQVTSGLADIVDEATYTAESAHDQTSPFAWAGIALAAVVVCAATVLLGRSRRREQDLLSGLGVRPQEVALLTAVELLVPALVGAAVGAGVAWVAVRTFGPPGDLAGAVPGLAGRSGLAALLAVALGTACAGLAAWAVDRRAVSSRLGATRRRVPWEAGLLAATAMAWVAVGTTDVARRPQSPLAVVFPLLLAASVSLLVLRGLDRAGVRRWVLARRAGSPRWLAGQRSRTTAGETAAVTLALAVGLSVLGYSLAVHRGVAEGVDDKVAGLVGAHTVVDVGEALATDAKHPTYPASPVRGGAIVFRGAASLPPEFGSRPLLAINTRTFARAADWGSTGTLERARPLFDDLRRKRLQVPVLLVGDTDRTVGDQGTLNFYDEYTAPYVVAGVVPAFPGSGAEAGGVAVVLEIRQLRKIIPRHLDPRRTPHSEVDKVGRLQTWVWSPKSARAVAAELSDAGITPQHAELRSTAAADNALLAAGWSSGYVVALGGAAMLLVAAAALVLAVRLADRDAVSDVLLRRMAYGTRELAAARTWEVAAAVVAALVAAAASIAAMVLGPSLIEPAGRVLPLTRPLSGASDALLLVVAAVVLVVAASAVARRRAGTRTAAEVLRGDG